MAFKRSWVRFPPAPPRRMPRGYREIGDPFFFTGPPTPPTLGFGGYVPGQNYLPAHLLDQETIPRSLEFFSRGRPTRRLLAPVRIFPRNLPQRCMREKAEDLLGDFQAVVGGWPSSLSWEPVPNWPFGLSKCIL